MSVAESEWSLLVTQNLIPGLIAIVLTGVLIRVWQRLKNAYVERKYPIGGTYISTFADSKADERDSNIYQNTEHYTAITELKQRGTNISGVSWTEYRDFEAGWELDGEITDDGYLVGQYVATNPHDQGKGTFFLYIRKNRYLNGIWAGYEDERGEINHGEYVFRPFLDVTIQDVSAEMRPATVGLLESTDCDTDVLEMIVNTEDRSGFTLTARTISDTSLVARARRVLSPALEAAGVFDSSHLSRERSDAKLVGAVIASVRSAQDIGSVLTSDRGLPTAVSCTEAVGVIDHVAVVERYRSRGVGTQLVEAAIERFERDGIDVVCIVGDENQFKSISGIMDTLDFDKRQLVETVHDGPTVSKSAQQVIYVKYNR